MRAVASVAGLVIAASLGACAQGAGLPDMGLLGGMSADANETAATAPQTETAAVNPADMPPLPSRNPKKRQATPNRTLTAANQPPPASERREPETGFSLSSLAQMNILTAGTPAAPDSIQSEASPVATYTLIAQQIHACWLTPGAPKLPNHGFHADVSPQDASTARIIIFEKGPDKKRGVQVFKITISGSGGGSVVTSENHRLDTKLDGAFKADLVRWARGDSSCKG